MAVSNITVSVDAGGERYRFIFRDDGTVAVYHGGTGNTYHPAELVPFPPDSYDPDES